MSLKIYHWLTMFVLIALAGCYPKGAEYVEELDLVYTNFFDQFDFKSRTTFSIPDSVIQITGDNFNDPDGDGKPQMVDPKYGDVILAQLNQQMTAAGWTKVDKAANPDVLLLASAMTTTNIYYYYDWWYWNWWYGGYWGWYYPGWYYPAYVTGYRSGSVFVQMVDAKAAPTEDKLPVVWSAIFNGLAEGSTDNINTRIQNGITQAFTQSPYLKH